MEPLRSAPTGRARALSGIRLASNLIEELWFAEDDPEDARDRAKASLAAQIAVVRGMKPFPVAASRLIEILGDPAYETRHVVEALESDPALAAKTLTVANSALFRTWKPCVTVADAIRRLGSRHVRDIAIGVSAMSLFADSHGIGEQLRDHSVGLGAVMRVLARAVLPAEESTLFLAGLLHEVGKLLLLQTSEIDYLVPRATGKESHVYEREELGFDHAVLGGCVLRLWRIPDPLPDIVAWHHQPARAFQVGGNMGLMVTLLRIGDRIEEALADGSEAGADELDELRADGSLSYAELSIADIRELWPALGEARRDALAR